MTTLRGHDDRVHSAAFSPDGMRVVTASADKTARVFDVETGRTLSTLEGHVEGVSSARFSPDGRRVLDTPAKTRTARIFDCRDGRDTDHARPPWPRALSSVQPRRHARRDYRQWRASSARLRCPRRVRHWLRSRAIGCTWRPVAFSPDVSPRGDHRRRGREVGAHVRRQDGQAPGRARGPRSRVVHRKVQPGREARRDGQPR